VLVTGGGRGLGLALSQAFAAAGAAVVACGRTVPDSIPEWATFMPCDVRDAAEVDRLAAAVVGLHGRLDVVVNNAGGGPYASAATMSPRLFERVVALNLTAPFLVAQRANEIMQGQDEGGVIINIGSAAARRPCPGTAAYNAAKAGLVVLTQTLAIEWAPKVRVNSVSVGLLRSAPDTATYGTDPGAVAATVPMGRLAEPSDVAAACVWLASPAAAYVTGADIAVDGGGQAPTFLGAVVAAAVEG
jgi:NAD(P)-dependent dehydrogenase (short-subunit alcohol dehydrogenase family)